MNLRASPAQPIGVPIVAAARAPTPNDSSPSLNSDYLSDVDGNDDSRHGVSSHHGEVTLPPFQKLKGFLALVGIPLALKLTKEALPSGQVVRVPGIGIPVASSVAIVIDRKSSGSRLWSWVLPVQRAIIEASAACACIKFNVASCRSSAR
jgi:hypothetical protein